MGEVAEIGRPHRNEEFAATLRKIADDMESGRAGTAHNLIILWTNDEGLESSYEGEAFSVLGMLGAAQTELVMNHQI